jgi:hypothetical protein
MAGVRAVFAADVTPVMNGWLSRTLPGRSAVRTFDPGQRKTGQPVTPQECKSLLITTVFVEPVNEISMNREVGSKPVVAGALAI